MILRKTLSVFLRTLRSLPQDQLPALPEKKLSKRQMKRLENAVFTRIAEEENRTVFDADPASVYETPRDPARENLNLDDTPYEITVIGGRGAWKRYLGAALAACLCFGILTTGILFRGDIAMYFAEHGWIADTDAVTDHEDTQAFNTEPFRPETTGVPRPENTAEGYSIQITSDEILENEVRLHVTLTTPETMTGLAVQYRRVVLSLWDPDVRDWRAKYDVYTSDQPKAEIMAGDIHFSLIGLGQTTTADAVITIPRDLNDYQGVWCLTLEGLTLVRDSSDASDPENTLIAEVLTDGSVNALFTSFEKAETIDPAETLPLRDTTTPPPDSAQLPLFASEDCTLMLSRVTVDGLYVTLDVVLDTPNGNPDGYAVYYRTEETELWNHEKQIWEGKHGTGFGEDDTVFAKMLCAGEVHFTVDKTSGNTFDAIKVKLGDHGWFRTTLRGLVLVREAKEGEEADFSNLVVEELDAGAVSVIYHID